MATIKSYTDLEQSKKLAEILPLENADMVLPFTHTEDDKYIPGYVISRKYVEVYNEMIKLIGMDKDEVHKLIQPIWSLSALLELIPDKISINNESYYLSFTKKSVEFRGPITWDGQKSKSFKMDNILDAVFEMVCWLKKEEYI